MKIKHYFYIIAIFTLFFEEPTLKSAEKDIQKNQKIQVVSQKNANNTQEKEDYFSIFQLSLFAPLQIIPEDYTIYGLKLGLPYSRNKKIGGLDLGLCNQVTETHYGVSCSGLMSLRSGEMYGANLSGLMNLSDANETGLSIAGLYNEIKASIKGVQLSAIINQAYTVKGMQIGLINYTRNLNGVQLGLLNFCKSQPFRFTFLVNAWNK